MRGGVSARIRAACSLGKATVRLLSGMSSAIEGTDGVDETAGSDELEALEPRIAARMASAPGPMVKASEANGALSVSIFEDHAPYTNNPVAAEFTKVFHERATKANLPETNVEVQAAASYTAWQLLEAAVVGTKSLDDKKMADWLKANKVDTIQGKLRFDGPSNYGDDLMRVKQVQNGKWLVVYPPEVAAPGAKMIVK